ncbi:MAG TPA: glycosyltransferase family 2 protein [Candidatus Acidoferrales bacterium]|nr:glycosyltransferase family 2 protein [Candidatus Acidoferrales bacterium]
MTAPTLIDVVLLTKNSQHLLSRCLTSVYRNVPIKRLIVIDGYSTDQTLTILEKFNHKYGNIQIRQMDGSRAKARTEGIRQVATEWFMFIDSDVLLCPGWFKKAKAELAQGVGAIWGLNIDLIPNVTNKWFLRFQSMIARQCFKLRGGMHDTLILKKAVEGIRIPEELHTYEDAYIVKAIQKRGYKTVIGREICCLHCKPPETWNLQSGIQAGITDLQCGLVYSHVFRYVLFYPVFFLYWAVQLPLNGFRNSKK